jgi:hypothetical protein
MTDEASRFDSASETDDDAIWPAPQVSVELGHPIAVETWGTADEVVAHHCVLELSGTLRIDGDPGVRVYLHDGLVYFAERTTDPELGFRLVLDGVISEDQLVDGTRLLEGGRHLGRMFANDHSIDRQRVVDEVVGYCADAVASLEGRAVSTYAFLPDEHHSSGILAWYSLDEETDVPSAPATVPTEPVSVAVPVAAVAIPDLEVVYSAAAPVPAPTAVPAAHAVVSPTEVIAPPKIVEPVAATLTDWLGPLELEPLVELDDDVEPVAANLSDWLGPLELEPLVEMDVDVALVVAEPRLPRRSRFAESIALTTEGGLGEVNISALQAAMTSIRSSNTATAIMTTRETVAPAVSRDAAVATDQVPGSPAERRRWVARRHR